MSRVKKVFLVFRNNWKKSLFAFAALSYGVSTAKNSYDNTQLMREYCLLASKYGDVTQSSMKPFRNITVVLNPAANKRNAKEKFEKYCAPLLHLAGVAVSVVYTEYAGQAKDIMDNVDPKTDALIIAGGDGTLSETITGLLRRAEGNKEVLKKLPIGVLPLGRSNTISTVLLGNKEEIRALADSAMAVIDGSLKTIDVMKIEPLSNEENAKPVYSLSQLEWGSFRNAKANRDKYWYFGKFRDHVSYLFTKTGDAQWECSYTEPCKGCNKCMERPKSNRRWWTVFIPNTAKPEVDYSNVVNENCGKILKKELSTVQIDVKTSTVCNENIDAPHLVMTVEPNKIRWSSFVSEGWRRLSGKASQPHEKAFVREVHLVPKKEKEDWLSIDNEDFEVKPMKISLVPKAINLFLPRAAGYV